MPQHKYTDHECLISLSAENIIIMLRHMKLILTIESLTLSYVRLYPDSISGSLLMSSSAMSTAGKAPEELKPCCP